LVEIGSEINRLQAKLDLMQKELDQVRAQIDSINGRHGCTTTVQAAPEAREELEQQKCETRQAVKISAPSVTATRAQWATEQEDTPSPTRVSTSKKRHCRCQSFSSTRTEDLAFLSMLLLVVDATVS
jgi:hypothetical protein